jgi:multidrug resistance efflux pump
MGGGSLKKRQYKVKSNKDFLIFGFVFFFLCIWAIKDAWFPSDAVLKKHPREIVSSFERGGQLAKMYVSEGDFVKEDSIIAELSSAHIDTELNEMKATYANVRKSVQVLDLAIKNAVQNGATKQSVTDLRNRKVLAEEKLEELQLTVNSLKDKQDELRLFAEKSGTVLEVYSGERIQIAAGEPLIKIHPQDNFYVFNKSLSIFSFFACIFFFVFHFFGN